MQGSKANRDIWSDTDLVYNVHISVLSPRTSPDIHTLKCLTPCLRCRYRLVVLTTAFCLSTTGQVFIVAVVEELSRPPFESILLGFSTLMPCLRSSSPQVGIDMSENYNLRHSDLFIDT
jgi:hypothetical protein